MKAVLFTLFTLLLQIGLAQAVSVQPGQEAIHLIIPQGKEASFYLIALSPSGENLISSSPWVTIEGRDSYQLPSGGTVFLKINASVPPGQDIGDYPAQIQHSSGTLSTLTITVTLPTGEIKTLQVLAEVNRKLSDLEDRLGKDIDSKLDSNLQQVESQINTFAQALSSSIQGVLKYEKDVQALEIEKQGLEGDIQNLTAQLESLETRSRLLQKQNSELEATGNLVRGESPLLFALGLLIGAGGIYLFYRRAHKYS